MKEAGEIIYLKLSEERIHKRLVSSSNMHRPQWKNRSSDDVKSMVETLVLRRKPYYEQASKILTLVDNYKIDCENLIRLIVND
jgi:shikimate kinase